MEKAFRVGLCGGIGSGKSTAANLFAARGASVVDTDVISHSLTQSGGVAMPAIAERFGSIVVARDGSLDRAAMRARVFADARARLDLENILHPLIRHEVQNQCGGAEGLYVVVVVPLLVEHFGEYRPLLDRIAVVDCPEALQVTRAASRPGLDVAQVHSIMATQSNRHTRLAIADDVIANHLDVAALAAQIEQLHGLYATLAEKKKASKANNALR
jgi:dephospho-CoA kinase